MLRVSGGVRTVSVLSTKTQSFSFVLQRFFAHGANFDSIRMGPAARLLLLRNNLNSKDITPTGPRGTLLKEDVVKFLESGKKPATQSVKSSGPKPAAPSTGSSRSKILFTDIEHENASQAELLVQSKFSIPHLYVTAECQIDDLLANLNKINDLAKSNISLRDFAIRALVSSFQSSQKGRTKSTGGVNVAVTLQTPENKTVTSTIQSAEKKSLLALSGDIQNFSTNSKSQAQAVSSSKGSSQMISFLDFPGGLGVTEYTEILGNGHSCVLSLGNVEKKVLIKDDHPMIGQVVKFTLSCDARLFLHSEAGKMAKQIQSFFESPSEMLI